MNIIRHLVPESTLSAFCDEHGLAIGMHERGRQLRESGLPRYWCAIPNAETKAPWSTGILSGAAGNGDTEGAALDAYASEISERVLVVDAMGAGRREILVPRITAMRPR